MNRLYILLSLSVFSALNPMEPIQENNLSAYTQLHAAPLHGYIRCKLCQKQIYTDYLIGHYNQEHQKPTRFLYECLLCHQTLSLGSISRHMQVMHSDALMHHRKVKRYLVGIETTGPPEMQFQW